MFSGVSTICFVASYAIALVLELSRLVWRSPWRRLAMLLMATAGLVAHTIYLATRAIDAQASPLSSPYDWCLLAAWLLAVLYLVQACYHPRVSAGLFLLPAILALIGAAQVASRQPFAPVRAHRFWGDVHGSFLLLGTVAVLIGFLTAVMYLIQSNRLKRKKPASGGFRLPSLEQLERVNTRSLVWSAVFVGIGLVSGLVLNTITHRREAGHLLFTDPVVLSLFVMFIWLVVAEIFRLVYQPARRGTKAAYLNVVTFVLLAVTLALLLLAESGHRPAPDDTEPPQALATRHLSTQRGVL